MVCVLPDDVCPYAKIVPLYPSRTSGRNRTGVNEAIVQMFQDETTSCMHKYIKKEKPHLLQSFGRRRCTLVLVLCLTERLCQTCTVYPGIRRRGGRRRVRNIKPIRVDL